jgi:hypothetical protein
MCLEIPRLEGVVLDRRTVFGEEGHAFTMLHHQGAGEGGMVDVDPSLNQSVYRLMVGTNYPETTRFIDLEPRFLNNALVSVCHDLPCSAHLHPDGEATAGEVPVDLGIVPGLDRLVGYGVLSLRDEDVARVVGYHDGYS